MPPKSRRKRADVLLTELGLAESREQAQTMIMEGLVFAPSGRVMKASSAVPEDAPLEVRGTLPYVSRGGVKLAHALETFGLDVTGQVALDVGASTGGFTDCLLQNGATQVYAVDVGYGQIHQRLREHPQVAVLEKVNARHPFDLPQLVDIITLDVSFISLQLVIPAVLSHLKPQHFLVALVKPQFEAQKGEVGRGGVIRDPLVHTRILGNTIHWTSQQDLRVCHLCASPIQGDAGNQEFFLLLQKP